MFESRYPQYYLVLNRYDTCWSTHKSEEEALEEAQILYETENRFSPFRVVHYTPVSVAVATFGEETWDE
jgi:hypothetical protein